MNSKEYITNKLRQLVEEFPQLTFLYQFDENDLTHVVEVTPLAIYEGNIEYKNAEGDFTYEFDRLFYPETIMFVSENSLTRVENVELIIREKDGVLWDKFDYATLFKNQLNFNFLPGDFELDKFVLPDNLQEFDNKIDYALAA